MNFDEMLSKVLEIFPDAEAHEGFDGEIVIATGMTATTDGTVIPLED
jgi:hypothetical protein